MKLTVVAIRFSIGILGTITLIFFIAGCGGGASSDRGAGEVIYSGPLYGDFIAIYEAVKACKGYSAEDQPQITIYARPFRCNEDEMGGGCFWEPRSIGMVGPGYSESGDHNNLVDTRGALFSHEAVHFLEFQMKQPMNQGDPCGTLELTNFRY